MLDYRVEILVLVVNVVANDLFCCIIIMLDGVVFFFCFFFCNFTMASNSPTHRMHINAIKHTKMTLAKQYQRQMSDLKQNIKIGDIVKVSDQDSNVLRIDIASFINNFWKIDKMITLDDDVYLNVESKIKFFLKQFMSCCELSQKYTNIDGDCIFSRVMNGIHNHGAMTQIRYKEILFKLKNKQNQPNLSKLMMFFKKGDIESIPCGCPHTSNCDGVFDLTKLVPINRCFICCPCMVSLNTGFVCKTIGQNGLIKNKPIRATKLGGPINPTTNHKIGLCQNCAVKIYDGCIKVQNSSGLQNNNNLSNFRAFNEKNWFSYAAFCTKFLLILNRMNLYVSLHLETEIDFNLWNWLNKGHAYKKKKTNERGSVRKKISFGDAKACKKYPALTNFDDLEFNGNYFKKAKHDAGKPGFFKGVYGVGGESDEDKENEEMDIDEVNMNDEVKEMEFDCNKENYNDMNVATDYMMNDMENPSYHKEKVVHCVSKKPLQMISKRIEKDAVKNVKKFNIIGSYVDSYLYQERVFLVEIGDYIHKQDFLHLNKHDAFKEWCKENLNHCLDDDGIYSPICDGELMANAFPMVDVNNYNKNEISKIFAADNEKKSIFHVVNFLIKRFGDEFVVYWIDNNEKDKDVKESEKSENIIRKWFQRRGKSISVEFFYLGINGYSLDDIFGKIFDFDLSNSENGGGHCDLWSNILLSLLLDYFYMKRFDTIDRYRALQNKKTFKDIIVKFVTNIKNMVQNLRLKRFV